MLRLRRPSYLAVLCKKTSHSSNLSRRVEWGSKDKSHESFMQTRHSLKKCRIVIASRVCSWIMHDSQIRFASFRHVTGAVLGKSFPLGHERVSRRHREGGASNSDAWLFCPSPIPKGFTAARGRNDTRRSRTIYSRALYYPIPPVFTIQFRKVAREDYCGFFCPISYQKKTRWQCSARERHTSWVLSWKMTCWSEAYPRKKAMPKNQHRVGHFGLKQKVKSILGPNKPRIIDYRLSLARP